MSIIYDALKKVEESKTKGSGEEIAKEVVRPQAKLKVYLLYILTVCFGLFGVNAFFAFLSHTKTSSKKQPGQPPPLAESIETATKQESSKGSPPVSSEQIPVKQAPVTETATSVYTPDLNNQGEAPFVLNGVFFSQDTGYALIDNQIVRVGDVINGAAVRRISLDEVELDNNGVTVKLSTRKR